MAQRTSCLAMAVPFGATAASAQQVTNKHIADISTLTEANALGLNDCRRPFALNYIQSHP